MQYYYFEDRSKEATDSGKRSVTCRGSEEINKAAIDLIAEFFNTPKSKIEQNYQRQVKQIPPNPGSLIVGSGIRVLYLYEETPKAIFIVFDDHV